MRWSGLQKTVAWAGAAGGLVIGLALTGCGSDGGAGERTAVAAGDSARVDPKLADLVVGRVGKREIRVRDIDEKIRLQFPDMAGLTGLADVRQEREVLKQMMDQYVWVETGERRGLDKEEEFKATLELSRKFILSNHTVKRLVYEKAEPTPEEIRLYYEENLDQFRHVARSEVSHILLGSRDEAERVCAQARGGMDFAELARRHSRDAMSKDAGGIIGTVTYRSELRGLGMKPEMNQRIMETSVGQVTEPMESEKGWSIFLVREHTPEQAQPLERVSEVIRKKLGTKKANEIFATILAEMRRDTGAELDEDAWLGYMVGRLSESEMMQLAQGEKVVKERIRIYEGMARHYGRSPGAAQALFMAGFTYADELQDYPRARESFEKMLAEHPQSELAESARWMLENMEKGLDNLPYADQVRRRASGG